MQFIQKLLNYANRSVRPTKPRAESAVARCESHIAQRRHAKRNRCLFLLNTSANLRPIDIASLRICDVLTTQGEIVTQLDLYSDKRNQPKHRMVRFDLSTRRAIRTYLLHRFNVKSLGPIVLTDTTRPLFVTQKCLTRGFSANTLGQYLHYLYKETGSRIKH